MRWLVTTRADLDRGRLRDILRHLGVEELNDLDPIPVDGDQVVEVEGPRNLRERAAGLPEIVAVHPSSEMTLY